MKAHFRLAKTQRGVAVVTALLLTTLAVTIVASLFWQQQVEVRSIENQRVQLQKQWILRSALDWASLILREDARTSHTDTLDEPWAVPLAETRLDQYVENGQADADIADTALSGNISDAQARLNLFNLCVGGKINPAEVASFARLLFNAKLDPALAQATAETMAAAQKLPPPDSRNTVSGPMPMNLTQVEDLLAVPGFTPAMLAKISDFVIFLPHATPVNVNTAPAEVLAAHFDGLGLPDALALVKSRNTASFRDLADFSHRLPLRPFVATEYIGSVTSNYFLVNETVRMNRASSNAQALIERNGMVMTKLIWIRER